MNTDRRVAGAAGIAAAILLMRETSSFLLSGWSPARFADPVQALELLRQGGVQLRVAALFGVVGLVAGLARALSEQAPSLATGTLDFGVIGVAGHSLVPLGLWIGIPAFLTLAIQNASVAESGWAPFAQVSNAAHGVGNFFGGLFILFAGVATMTSPVLSKAVGWIGLIAGLLTLTTLLTVGTLFGAVGGALFMPALALTVLFRFWRNRPFEKIALIRPPSETSTRGRPSP